MCRYCQYIDGQLLPVCAPLNALCTACVFGDRKMYELARAKEEENAIQRT